jgi:hypothetical protein
LAVPEDLRVHVGVRVDEARRDDEAVGIDLACALLLDPAHQRDAVADDADIGAVAAQPGAVDHRAAPDHQIKAHGQPPRLVWRPASHNCLSLRS